MNWVMRFLRTSLPPMVWVLEPPVPPLTAVALAPTTDRFSVERFSIRSLPSFEARILSASETLPLIEVTSWSTVCATLATPFDETWPAV